MKDEAGNRIKVEERRYKAKKKNGVRQTVRFRNGGRRREEIKMEKRYKY